MSPCPIGQRHVGAIEFGSIVKRGKIKRAVKVKVVGVRVRLATAGLLTENLAQRLDLGSSNLSSPASTTWASRLFSGQSIRAL